jgi:hypothetical protein
MSGYYAAVSALIFAVVALGHLLRILKQWTVQIGALAVPMSVSWIGLGFHAVGPLSWLGSAVERNSAVIE